MMMLLSDEHERVSMTRECSLYLVGVAHGRKVTGGVSIAAASIARRIRNASAASKPGD